MNRSITTRRVLKEGQYVYLTRGISNNKISLDKLTKGKIVHVHSRNEVDVWFYDYRSYKNSLGDLDSSYGKDGRFRGIVLTIKADSLAVVYDFTEHCSVLVPEEKALRIPFFTGWEEKKVPSNLWKMIDGERVRTSEYKVQDIIDYVDELFEEWVKDECNRTEVTKEEKESGEVPEEYDWIFTDESQIKFEDMQRELEMEFAKQTGIYYHFTGGTVEV